MYTPLSRRIYSSVRDISFSALQGFYLLPLPTSVVPTLVLMDGGTGSLGVLRLVMPSGSRVDMSTSTSLPQGDLITTTTTGTITYAYDPLYRLTAAEYSDGTYFHYTHDAVGNRQTLETTGGVITYTYDIANRMTSAGGVAYTWDSNGNLLADGASSYTYDSANRLTGVSGASGMYGFTYNGLGDRMQSTVDGVTTSYSLDLAGGLTQVLADSDGNAYLYGHGRIAQEGAAGMEYFLTDALGSVRQLVDASGNVTLARSYRPYGGTLASDGDGASPYGFTGEWTDATGMVHLRARYLDTGVDRFITRDTWGGDPGVPMSYNFWLYVLANPTRYVDPSGHVQCDMLPPGEDREGCENPTPSPYPCPPSTTNYDPRMQPSCITFIPSFDPLAQGAPGLPKGVSGAQNNVPGWVGTKNLCGLVSLAAIFYAYDSSITTEDVVDKFADWRGGDPGMQGYGELENFVNYPFNALHWKAHYPAQYPLRQRLEEWLLGNQYMLQVIEYNADITPARIITTRNGVPHWVVVTGVSRRNQSSSDDRWDWVRIYDPYRNQTMYYPYQVFKDSKELHSPYVVVQRMPEKLNRGCQ